MAQRQSVVLFVILGTGSFLVAWEYPDSAHDDDIVADDGSG